MIDIDWPQLGQDIASLSERRTKLAEVIDRLEMASVAQRRDDGELSRLKHWIKGANMAEISDLAHRVSNRRLCLPSDFEPIFAQTVNEQVELLKHELEAARKRILDQLPDKIPGQKRFSFPGQPVSAH